MLSHASKREGALFLQVVSAGADGLVKLWSVRTSECTATFDEHEGKVWALAAAGLQSLHYDAQSVHQSSSACQQHSPGPD